MSTVIYPHTPRIEVTEEHFGCQVIDPYRWLEGDARVDSAVEDWIEAQSTITADYLAGLPGRNTLRDRLSELFHAEQFTAPYKRGGYYFYVKNSGLDNQPSLYRRDAISGEEDLLIDPNSWSEDGADALGEWAVSDDGELLAYGVQQGGTDWRTISIMKVSSKEVLKDKIEWARFTQIVWTANACGIFYSRFPAPEEGIGSTAGITDHSVYYHAVGKSQSEDRLVYSTPEDPSVLNIADRTDDGRYLLIYSTPGAGVNALSVMELASDTWTSTTVVKNFDAEWSVIGNLHAKLFILTSDNAERRKIVTLDLADERVLPAEIVPEDEAVLTSAALLGGRLIATYLVDAKTELRRYLPDGTPDGCVQLPGIGSAGGLRGQGNDREAFFLFSSFDTPITVYRYDVHANSYDVWAQPKAAMSAGPVSVVQRFCISADGTKVPLFIIRREGLTGPRPTLLFGYGGFGISSLPVYSAAQLAWVEQGGVVAVANIRGGGEYGKRWHQAGQLLNKQSVFDDFISAGEFLKAQGFTSDDGLVIQGESNGGLLVGAVVNQRPDLFAAALPGVGVMDMLRYPLFTGGRLWISEFGSPDEQEHFHNLLSYSPYHNIQSGKRYPAILATTADADDRVVPAHTFKYIAALQAAEIGPRPHLIRIETRAGHGAGMSMARVIEQIADMWAFAAHWSGLKLEDANESIRRLN